MNLRNRIIVYCYEVNILLFLVQISEGDHRSSLHLSQSHLETSNRLHDMVTSTASSSRLHDPTSPTGGAGGSLEEQMREMREESSLLHDQVGKQETELHKMRAQLGSLREERDRLKRRVMYR